MLIFVTPEKRASVLKSLQKLLPVPFQFERGGTQIVLYEPQLPATATDEPHPRSDLGATGFIGRNLVETLSRRDDLEVHAVRFTRPEYAARA